MGKIQQSLFFASSTAILAALAACTIAPDDGNPSYTSVDPVQARNGEYEYRREATKLNPKGTDPKDTAPAPDVSGVTAVKDKPATQAEQEQLKQLKGKVTLDAEISVHLDRLNVTQFAEDIKSNDTATCTFEPSALTLPAEQDPGLVDALIATAFVNKDQRKNKDIKAAKKKEILETANPVSYVLEFTVTDPATGKISGSAKPDDGTPEIPLSDRSFVRKTGDAFALYLEFVRSGATHEDFPPYVANLEHEPINPEHNDAGYDRHLLKRGRSFEQTHLLTGTLTGSSFQGTFEIYALNKSQADMINCYFKLGGRLGDTSPTVKAEWSTQAAPASAATITGAADGGQTTAVPNAPGAYDPASDPTGVDEGEVDTTPPSVVDAPSGTGEPALAKLDELADVSAAPEFVYTDDVQKGYTLGQIERQCQDGEVKIEIAHIPTRVRPSDYIPYDTSNARRKRIQKRITEISANGALAAGLFVEAMDLLYNNPKKIYFQLRGCYSTTPGKPSLVFFHTNSRRSKFDMQDPTAVWQKFPENLTRFVDVGNGKVAFRANLPRYLTPDEVTHIVCFKNGGAFCNGVEKDMSEREAWPRSVTQFLAYLVVDPNTKIASKLQKLPKGRKFKKSRFIYVSTHPDTLIETDWDESGREVAVVGSSRKEFMEIAEDASIALVGNLDVLKFEMGI